MRNIGILGFGKSFIAFNLAGVRIDESYIYADRYAPYRSWNASEKSHIDVREQWDNSNEKSYCIIDHRESDVVPDVLVYSVAPDAAYIDTFRTMRKDIPVVPILNGLVNGSPWLFGNVFDPVIIVEWDGRQSATTKLGLPLSQRDKRIAQKFDRLWGAIDHVAHL